MNDCKKYYIIIIIILFSSFKVLASEPRTKSEIKEEFERVQIRSVTDVYNNNYFHQLDKLNKESKEINYSYGEIWTTFLKSYLYHLRGNSALSLKEIEKIDPKYLRKNPENDATIYNYYRLVGLIYMELKFYERSIEYFKEGISRMTNVDDLAFLLYIHIAYDYQKLNDYYSQLNYIKKAENSYIRASKKSEYYKLPDYRYLLDSQLAFAYSNLKMFSISDHYLQLSYKNVEKTSSEAIIAFIYNDLTDTEVNFKHFDKAWENILNVKKFYKNSKISSLSTDLEISEKLLTLSKQTHIKDSINFYTKKVNDINNLISLREGKAKDYALDKVLNDQIEKSNNKTINIIIISIILLSIILAVFLLIRRKKTTTNPSTTVTKTKENNKPVLTKEAKETSSYSDEKFKKLNELAKNNSPEFLTLFKELYPQFIKKILEVDPKTTNSELRFYSYLFLNYSTKDIAQFTNTSIRTVQTKKYNVRKKLQIPTGEDIYLWFSNLMN